MGNAPQKQGVTRTPGLLDLLLHFGGIRSISHDQQLENQAALTQLGGGTHQPGNALPRKKCTEVSKRGSLSHSQLRSQSRIPLLRDKTGGIDPIGHMEKLGPWNPSRFEIVHHWARDSHNGVGPARDAGFQVFA